MRSSRLIAAALLAAAVPLSGCSILSAIIEAPSDLAVGSSKSLGGSFDAISNSSGSSGHAQQASLNQASYARDLAELAQLRAPGETLADSLRGISRVAEDHGVSDWEAEPPGAPGPSPGELGFVYVGSNVGTASGGHAALAADGVVYHLQNAEGGLVLVVRDGWSAFHTVYQSLGNRPLTVAHLDVTPAVDDAVQRAFSRLYVEQELALARRDAARDDVAWLEAFAAGTAAPPLRGAGLVDPARAGDPDAERLRERVGSVRREMAPSPSADVESLRERLLADFAERALAGAWGLEPAAIAELPAELAGPLGADERDSLESLSAELEHRIAALLRSERPDRGRPLLLAQARWLAAQRSLAENRLVVLDPFAGAERPDELDEALRGKRRAQAAELLRRGRALVLAQGRLDEASLNLVEEAAGAVAHDGRTDAAGPLSEVGLRKLPARARAVAATPPAGELGALLAGARARLAALDARIRAEWSYEVVRRNCITELARTANGAFGSDAEVERALGARVPGGDEPFGFVPLAFFARVRDRLRVDSIDELPARRAVELERVLAESPGPVTRLRESTSYGSTVYTPRLRDGAFLLFTDDVFWPRPAYGLANLGFALGYSGFGLAAAPFDRGARLRAGLSGALWSMPELWFVNVRKGTYDWAD